MIILRRLLRDICQNRIRPAERHHRHLAEEDRDLAEDIIRSETDQEGCNRDQPQRQPDCGHAQRPRWVGLHVVGNRLTEHAVNNSRVLAATVLDRLEFLPAKPRTNKAHDTGRNDDHRERHGKEEDRDERDCGDRNHHRIAQRALADPHHRLDDDGEHRGLQAEE